MQALRETEYAFFGLLSDDPADAIVEAMSAGVDESFFTDQKCILAWRSVASLWQKKKPSEIAYTDILQEAFRISRRSHKEFSGVRLDTAFYDEATRLARKGEPLSAIIEYLRDGASNREISQLMTDAKIAMDSGNSQDAAQNLVHSVTQILAKRTTANDLGVYDLAMSKVALWKNARTEVQEKGNKDFVIGLPIPWREVSKRFRGLQTGMHVIAARPSVGKTSFALQFAIYLASAGYKVGFNSLDMPVSQLVSRPVSCLSNVPLSKLDNGEASKEELAAAEAACETLQKWQNTGNLSLTSKFSVTQFKSWCMLKHAAGQLDIVFVDYIQKMTPARKTGNENSDLTEVSQITSSIAKDLNIPVIALAQLNRANEKADEGAREPRISDIRSCGAIEQDAFTISLLYRDEGVEKKWKDNPPQMIAYGGDMYRARNIAPVWLHLAKNQNGGLGRFPFIVLQDVFRWHLGDAKADKVGGGAGVNIQKFSSVTADGRFPDYEAWLTSAGNLRQTPVGGSEPSSWKSRASASPLPPAPPTPPPMRPMTVPAFGDDIPTEYITDANPGSDFNSPVPGYDDVDPF